MVEFNMLNGLENTMVLWDLMGFTLWQFLTYLWKDPPFFMGKPTYVYGRVQ